MKNRRLGVTLAAILGVALPLLFFVVVPTAYAQSKANSACNGNTLQFAEGESDGWIVPDNVFRFQLLRPSPPSFRTRQPVADDQIQLKLAKVGACYNIKSVTVTTKSEVRREMIQYRDLPITEVWNDSLILVLERKR